jgi:hypothetical protein
MLKTEKRIEEKLPDLIERMLELAEGVTVKDEDRKGNPRIYQKPPDRQAAEYLIDIILKSAEKRPDSAMPKIKIIEVTTTEQPKKQVI